MKKGATCWEIVVRECTVYSCVCLLALFLYFSFWIIDFHRTVIQKFLNLFPWRKHIPNVYTDSSCVILRAKFILLRLPVIPRKNIHYIARIRDKNEIYWRPCAGDFSCDSIPVFWLWTSEKANYTQGFAYMKCRDNAERKKYEMNIFFRECAEFYNDKMLIMFLSSKFLLLFCLPFSFFNISHSFSDPSPEKKRKKGSLSVSLKNIHLYGIMNLKFSLFPINGYFWD